MKNLLIKSFIYLGTLILPNLSHKTICILAKGIASILSAFCVGKYVAYRNFELAFSDAITEGEKKSLYYASLRNILQIMLEAFWITKQDIQVILDNVHIEDKPLFEEIKASKRGIVILGGHYSNWEFHSLSLAGFYGKKYHAFTGKQKHNEFDRALNKMRLDKGLQGYPLSDITNRELIQALKNGEIVGFCNDSCDPNKRYVLPWFNSSVTVNEGPAILAAKTNSRVFFSGFTRINGKLEFSLSLKEIHYDRSQTLK